MKNFSYGRAPAGVQLNTLRGHRLGDFCATESEIDAVIQAVKDELDEIAAEMKVALTIAVEVD